MTYALANDLAARARTRWSMATSFSVHVALLLFLILMPRHADQAPELTEIVMIEPGELTAASALAAGAPAPAERSVRGAPTASTENETFRRAARTAELRPEPQSLAAFEDRISARLAAMERNTPTPVRGTSVTALTSSAWGSPAQAGTVPGSGASPLSLHRGGGASSGPALPLTRGGGGIAPAVVATGLPSGVTEASRAARGGDAEAHRQLAGATLAGPIADRPVVSMVRPTYPEWAKRDAVEGSVTLYFIVRPDGSVLDNVLVQKTAGFEDFDESARAALRAWRFAALREGRTGEQWGTITFHFRLQEAG